MSKTYSLVFFLFSAAVLSQTVITSAAVTHQLELTNSTGHVIQIVDDNPNLPGPFYYVCNRGVWIVYTVRNYSSHDKVQILYVDGECLSPFIPMIRSARAIGAREDNSLPSVTFFNQTNVGGEIMVTTSGVTSFQFPVLSFIAMNGDFVQFFSEPNYLGDSFCVELLDVEVDWYWNWEGLSTPFPGSSSQSARLGCIQQDSAKIVKRPTPPATVSKT